MNAVLKSGFLLAFSLMSAGLMSKDRDFSLSVKKAEAKTLHFEVSNAKNLSLFIYNDADGEIYAENLNDEDQIAKSYDLQALAPGTYYLVAESESKVEKYKITISKTNTIEMDKTPVSSVTKPEFTVSGHMVKLHVEGPKYPVNVSVYDSSNNVHYSGNKVAEDGAVDLTFDLNPQIAETYTIRVEENGNVFNKIISLK
ncbi:MULTISPECIES: hypothetical protein [Chryseobacterium]|uniref:Membrane protein n=1 Tax=Chryseobacterium camelliae TaxID=1265445 RepID=A0ABU0TH03_9FLAO|nr:MULTISPECIES: hypothetical protein [Chryseobacterium]MDT3406093.1 putative membrane protein [Pseudacidovorax intermedius]MDQ1096106.1 putative membrane protein [Chryseobacterium camelliae]MDQ1100042.1 putative membrane protein [Chryseobacterium sp. SORGH_AS_1048]MDR6087385.1 putative membrane protein [Chryseobacterium sp. SORGH_AS_0909]MDR6131760.1 putative membrane protein [Chryseobacterium sp. SORGH_AS_1175]